MIKRIGIIGAVCAITLFFGSFSAYATAGDDMPVVEDQPLTEADIAEMEAEQSERLTQAQQALITLGYLEGRADGISGPRTQAAIRASWLSPKRAIMASSAASRGAMARRSAAKLP